MKTSGFITAGVLLGLSGGIIVGAGASSRRHDQEEEQKSKFYAVRVESEKNVQNAKDSLGAPDGHFAEILPGGELVLIMEKNFIESGSVVYKGETQFNLEGWFHIQDTQDERQNYQWMDIHRLSPSRFTFLSSGGYFYTWWGNTGVNKIRITNIDTKPLLVDAVIGYGLEAGKN